MDELNILIDALVPSGNAHLCFFEQQSHSRTLPTFSFLVTSLDNLGLIKLNAVKMRR